MNGIDTGFKIINRILTIIAFKNETIGVNILGIDPQSATNAIYREGMVEGEYLTPDGMQALKSGEFVSPIGEDVRERYRNPPAHTRFIPLSIAQESRKHVNRSIQCYSEWIK